MSGNRHKFGLARANRDTWSSRKRGGGFLLSGIFSLIQPGQALNGAAGETLKVIATSLVHLSF